MDTSSVLIGTLIVVATFYDVLHTTISMSGSGPLTRGVSRVTAALANALVRPFGGRSVRTLRGAVGPFVLSSVAFVWIAVPMVGYGMIFHGIGGLTLEPDGAPGLFQAMTFAGSRLSTLGAANATPAYVSADFLAMVASVNGMVVLTLSVSFLMNVIQTTSQLRSFALRVDALDHAGRLNGSPTSALCDIAALGPMICGLVVDLTHSPLSRYFSPSRTALSFPDAVLRLADLIAEADGHPPEEVGSEFAQLRRGLAMLGPVLADPRSPPDLHLTRRWAREHAIGSGG